MSQIIFFVFSMGTWVSKNIRIGTWVYKNMSILDTNQKYQYFNFIEGYTKH